MYVLSPNGPAWGNPPRQDAPKLLKSSPGTPIYYVSGIIGYYRDLDRIIRMDPARSVIKLLALAVTLVMLTGVALPAVVQACMMMMEQSTAMNLCCPNSEGANDPCHGSPADDPGEEPLDRQADVKACCPSDDGTIFDDAILKEAEESLTPAATDRPALATEITARPQIPLTSEGDVARRSGPSGTSLHLLYGVMLN
jgi:hypothetical protein